MNWDEMREMQLAWFRTGLAVLLMLVITGITTFTGLTVYPELARDLAAFSNDNIIGISTRYNIGGYDIVYCVVLAIPLYCLVIEKKVTTGIKKFLEIFIFIISLIFIVKTQYTTAMLLEIVSFLVFNTADLFEFWYQSRLESKVSVNAQTLEHAVPNLRNSVEKIIVIENKANYESMEYDPKVLYIFCHGYFSPKEVRFLQMLMKTAPEEIQCYHWGDMDYGGIQIFLYNEKNIFPNLIPWKMDVPSYKAALEKEKGIKLCSKKQKKLEALNAGKLEVLKQCILENKMEIEQEMLI